MQKHRGTLRASLGDLPGIPPPRKSPEPEPCFQSESRDPSSNLAIKQQKTRPGGGFRVLVFSTDCRACLHDFTGSMHDMTFPKSSWVLLLRLLLRASYHDDNDYYYDSS